ncbi:RNA-binding protein MEX3B [Perognathus longimembris pacificus]|uniref:RNA-binding protein MEX3B n=1 Tax=Perognathus longimembris pacificus TaxID=214514 RepID=UPI00201A0C64|nr:RNA-binding protein MEX3B [Perognathus longimembris pacificus]
MPSSLFADLERGGGGESPDEQSALRLALDQLSLLGLDDEGAAPYGEPRRRSVNMTECVPVPSSEHVAEIVGRQGCKIKALRAKTNTYIKTPVRGEEPVFVVTGRKEDVAMARREIISAAEHFSMIRASRHKSAALSGGAAPGPPALPGQTTIQVRVPYRVVGLVVGPKGATIKRIQQQTHTYIVTPSRDKEPVFEVTGMPENVDRAREEIEAHIALRTGGLVELPDGNDFHANGTDVGFDPHGAGAGALWSKASPGRKPFASFRNDSSSSLGSASTDSYFGGAGGSAAATPRLADFSPPSPALGFAHNGTSSNGNGFTFAGEAAAPSPEGSEPPPAFDPAPAPPPGAPLLWAPFERSPGPASAATASTATASTTASAATAFPAAPSGASLGPGPGSRRLLPGSCPRLSPPLHAAPGTGEHRLARRVRSDPGGGGLAFAYASGLGAPPPGLPPTDPAGDAAGSSSASSSSSSSSSSSCSSSGPRRKGSRDCAVCLESEVIAALVPCGHNLFCLECAHRICQRSEPRCPVCHAAVTQAIRIFS